MVNFKAAEAEESSLRPTDDEVFTLTADDEAEESLGLTRVAMNLHWSTSIKIEQAKSLEAESNACRPLDDGLECPICYEELTLPFTTICGHTYCRECLYKWLAESPACPSCRRALYVDPIDADVGLNGSTNLDSEDESDGEDFDEEVDDPTNEATARRLAADTGVITTTFPVDRDNVVRHLEDMYKRDARNLDYDATESDELVKVDYQSQIEACIAAVLLVKPHRGDAHTLNDVCHSEWEEVAKRFHDVLRREDGEIMEARELYWQLFDEVGDNDFVVGYPDYSQAVRRAHVIADGDDFEGDLYQVTALVVKNARDAYTGSFEAWMQEFWDWEAST